MTAISPLAPARQGPNLLLRLKYRTGRNEFLVNDSRLSFRGGPTAEPGTHKRCWPRTRTARFSVIGKIGVYGFRALRCAEPQNDSACVRSPPDGRGGSGAAHVDLPLRRPDGRVLHHQPVRRRQRKPRPGAEALPLALAGQAHGPGARALRLDAQRPAARLVPEEALAGDLHAVHAVLVAAGGDAVGAPEALVGLRRRIRPRLRLSRQSDDDAKSDKNQRASLHRVHLPGRPSAEPMLAQKSIWRRVIYYSTVRPTGGAPGDLKTGV